MLRTAHPHFDPAHPLFGCALVADAVQPHDLCMRIAPSVLASLLALATTFIGCAGSHRARDVDLAGLDTRRILTQGLDLKRTDDSESALYVYRNQLLTKARFTKLLLEPVSIHSEGDLDANEAANYQTLADNAFLLVRQQLAQDFDLVSTPTDGAMRMQITILDAQPASSVRRVVASVSPVGRALSLANYAVTGKRTAVGEITVEILITDSITGTVLGAAIDRRVGTENLRQAIDVWQTANDALAQWAIRLREQLRLIRQSRKD